MYCKIILENISIYGFMFNFVANGYRLHFNLYCINSYSLVLHIILNNKLLHIHMINILNIIHIVYLIYNCIEV